MPPRSPGPGSACNDTARVSRLERETLTSICFLRFVAVLLSHLDCVTRDKRLELADAIVCYYGPWIERVCWKDCRDKDARVRRVLFARQPPRRAYGAKLQPVMPTVCDHWAVGLNRRFDQYSSQWWHILNSYLVTSFPRYTKERGARTKCNRITTPNVKENLALKITSIASVNWF